jgi:molybdopterin/thiamine biosynthesis adenylyltransferase/nitroreductase
VTLATCAFGSDHEAWLARICPVQVRDIYAAQVAELALVRLPGGSEGSRQAFAADYSSREPGMWSYYPWRSVALRTLEPGALGELRTNRNRNLVTSPEQAVLGAAHVAVAGLSVGFNVVSALVHHGIGGTYSLADHDTLATSNLNRTYGSLLDVGMPKSQLAARAVWEVNPFATCVLFSEGLSDATVGAFVADSDLVVDELDDFRVKVQLRLAARSSGKALLMATNLGDSILLDVERWDLGRDGLEPFNGQLDGVSLDELMGGDLSAADVSRFAAQVIGVENVPLRALASLPLIGRELAGRPQVASTAQAAAGLTALAARSVLLGAPLRSGRYRVSLAGALGLPEDQGRADERAAIMSQLRPARAVTAAGAAARAGLSAGRPGRHDVSTLAGDGAEEALTRLAAYGTLAPSPHNTQPWRFGVAGGWLTIEADTSRALPVADPRHRALAISVGCAAMSVLVAAAASGLGMLLEIAPAGTVRLGVADAQADPALAALFPALVSRVTDKRAYPPEAVSPVSLAWPEDVAVHYVADRQYLADLHRDAAGELARTGAFARELAGWLRTDPADPRRDGMTLPLPPARAAALIAALGRSGEPLREMGERDAEAIAAGPLAGLLTTAQDTSQAWIRAGLAWQHLALAAHTAGLAVAPLTAVVENPDTREAAAALIPDGQHVQMLFRLGRPPGPLPPTPRRDPAWAR